MKKLVFIFIGLLISISGYARGPKGGDSPFPHGTLIDFPWESIEGCMQSTTDENLWVKVSKLEIEEQKLVQISINRGSERAVGLGALRNNIVSAFMSAVSAAGDRQIFLAHLGRYCLADVNTPDCKTAIAISLVVEKEGVSEQQDHVLLPVTDPNQCENQKY